MTATVPEQPGEGQLRWERSILPGVWSNLPQKASLTLAHGHNTARQAKESLLSLGHDENSTKICVNEHSPGVRKPKAWLTSELPWLKANLFYNICIFNINYTC